MKRILPLLFLTIAFVACKKEEKTVDAPLPEQTLTDVSYGSDAAQKMDVYLPAGRTTTATKAMIMIHGGGWLSGDKADMNDAVAAMKARLPEYAVFNVNYRLAAFPANNVFPTQENDIKSVVNFVLGKAQEYKFNADKWVILGASAGGHLALLQAYKNAAPKPKAVVDYFGPTDMVGIYNAYSGQTQLAIQVLMSGTPATNPALYQSSSPINYVSASVPPTIILHGTADPVVPIAQSTALKAKLDAAGASVVFASYTGAGHGDWTPAQFDDSYTRVVNFLKDKNP